jgi:hypothetical protein
MNDEADSVDAEGEAFTDPLVALRARVEELLDEASA